MILSPRAGTFHAGSQAYPLQARYIRSDGRFANASKIDLVMKGGKVYRPVELLRTIGSGATSNDR